MLGFTDSNPPAYDSVSPGTSLFTSIGDPSEIVSDTSHPLIDYQDKWLDGSVDLATLIAARGPVPVPAVPSLCLSHWNPPPAWLRMKGHLLYLQASTLEGKTFHITAHSSGFYVCNSSGHKFDPSPKKISGKVADSESLLQLLLNLSPSALLQLEQNKEVIASRDPLAFAPATNSFTASPWLLAAPITPLPDLTRTQDITGSIAALSARDWNEDLQSTREMPQSNIQERIIRERLLHKLSFDFCQAAVRTAIAIVRGDIPSLNPADPELARIYLYNNIFFSYGSDGIGTFANEGGDSAARSAVGKDVLGVNFVNNLDIDGIYTIGTVVIDYCGRRIVAQSVVPGIFRQNPKGGNQIVYGGIEGRDEIANDESYEPLMSRIAEASHLKPHVVADKDGNAKKLATSVETKGLNGTDGRQYVLDLYRLAPLDLNFIEANAELKENAYPHRLAVLRMEAVDDWWKNQIRQQLIKKKEEEDKTESKETESKETESKETEKEEEVLKAVEGEQAAEEIEKVEEKQAGPTELEILELSKTFQVNPDVTLDGPGLLEGEDLEAYKKDEDTVRLICTHVTDTIIPSIISDIRLGTISTPLDGTQLTSVLHKRGINIRYLGLIHSLCQGESALKPLDTLVVQEALARAIKHELNTILVSQLPEEAAISITDYLNSLFTPSEADSQVTKRVVDGITSQVLARYRLELDEDWVKNIKAVPLFREISLKLGLQWKLPSLKVSAGSSIGPFEPEDLINFVPIISSSTFRSSLAEEALETGRISVIQGDKTVGLELLHEALTLYEQAYGLVHPLVAKAYSQVALVYHELNESDKACEFGRRAVILSERTNGVDSAEAIFVCLNLALFEHAREHTPRALQIIHHAISLWSILYGPDHPDSITTINNIATMLQTLKLYKSSEIWFQRSIDLMRRTTGQETPALGALYFQLSHSQASHADYRAGVDSMRQAARIFDDTLGPEDDNSKESHNWLDQLLAAAVSVAKQDKLAKKTPLNIKPVAPKPQAPSSPGPNVADKSIDELVNYINGTTKKSKKGRRKATK